MAIKRGYLALFTGFVLGIIVSALISSIYMRTTGSTVIVGKPKRIEIVFLYSSEKQGWLEEVTPEFEKEFYQRFGIMVDVKLVPAGSHESVDMILRGYKPTIWSPASSIWIPYLNEKWKEEHGTLIVKDWVPIVYSPIVIAGWRDFVEKYNIASFMDIYYLIKNGVKIKWGHTDPRLSNSGTMITILEFAEAAGKEPDKLTVTDITNETVLNIVRTIESAAVAYGKSTGFFGAWAVESGPQAITLFGVYENIVIEHSLDAKKRWGEELVAIYPRFGTLYSDHPFVILDADWINEWQRFAALQYLYFLLRVDIQMKAQAHGFRPVNPSVPLDTNIFSKRNGVQPEIRVRVFRPPSGKVLDAILSLWEKVKNPGV